MTIPYNHPYYNTTPSLVRSGDTGGRCGIAEWVMSDARQGTGRRWWLLVEVPGQFACAISVVDDFGTLIPVERLQ